MARSSPAHGDLTEWFDFFNYCLQHPEDSKANQELQAWLSVSPKVYENYMMWQMQNSAYESVGAGGNPNDVYGQFANAGLTPSGEFEKWLDNATSQYNTKNAQQFETAMRDSSYLSAGSQLSQLGLSPSGVLQVGGASSNGVAAASTSHQSLASLAQQQRINSFNQKMSIAKSLISAASSMASSGIYGSAIGAVKHSAAAVSASAAHSGYNVLKKWSGYGNGSLMSGKLAADWSKLPGAY